MNFIKCFAFCVCLLSKLCYANDQSKIDSLKLLLTNQLSDSAKIDILIQLCKENITVDTSIAFQNSKEALKISLNNKTNYKGAEIYHLMAYINYQNHNYQKAIQQINNGLPIAYQKKDTSRIGKLLYLKGSIYLDIGDYDSSLFYYKKGLDFFQRNNLPTQIAEGYRAIGGVKWLQGDYALATEYIEKSIPIYEQIGYETGKGWALNILAILCFEQELYTTALEFYDSAYEILKKNNDESGVATILLNKGEIYWKRKEYSTALELYNSSLELSIKHNNLNNVAYCYSNIGIVYFETKNYQKADENYQKAMAIWEQIGDKTGLIYCLNYIAILKYETGLYSQAINSAQKVLSISTQIGSKDEKRRAYETLSKAYSKIGLYKKAYKYHVKFKELNDTIFDGKTKNRLLTIESRNKLEKQKQQLEFQQIEIELKDTKIEQQNIIRNALLLGLSLVIIVILLIAYAYYQKKKANIEITSQKNKIEKQKEHIEAIHDELTSSIRYASRIQGAVLPSIAQMSDLLGDYFVLFKPKDIVSGDFYWATRVKQWIVFCVADCTGHGVPGAFMSMLGISFLNDIVHKEQVTNASEILNHLRFSIIAALKQRGEGGEQKDGMDMGLCVIDTKTLQLQYAGGYNPCWVVPNPEYPQSRFTEGNENFEPEEVTESSNIIQLKPDKMPIAIHKHMESYTNHTLQLFPGDKIYLMSDGFQDQFGGKCGKKFMVKNLRELVASNANLPMKSQLEELEHAFENWRGELEQIDDVTILGVTA